MKPNERPRPQSRQPEERATSGSRTARLAREMYGACLHMRSRLISRVVTRLFDDELRSLEITGSQLNLLAAIAAAGPVRRGDIGRYLQIDPSTLTRNLHIMSRNGWIEETSELADGRGAPLRITPGGEALIARAAPSWRVAQSRAEQLLGDRAARELAELSLRLTT